MKKKFVLAILLSILCFGCGDTTDFEHKEKDIKISNDYSTKETTGYVEIDSRLVYEEYLQIIKNVYQEELDEKTKMSFTYTIDDWICGVDEDCKIKMMNQNTGEKLIVIDNIVGYMYMQEMKIYFWDMESSFLMAWNIETDEIETIYDKKRGFWHNGGSLTP